MLCSGREEEDAYVAEHAGGTGPCGHSQPGCKALHLRTWVLSDITICRNTQSQEKMVERRNRVVLNPRQAPRTVGMTGEMGKEGALRTPVLHPRPRAQWPVPCHRPAAH